MESIQTMRKRHDKEIADLQKNCKHENHSRRPYMWAIGHFGNDVEVCDFCEKILKTYPMEASYTETSSRNLEVLYDINGKEKYI